MNKFSRNTLLWTIAITLVVINQLLVISISTYPSHTFNGKIIMIAPDVMVAIFISVITMFLFTIVMAIIPYGALTYKKRFRNVMPIALILTELITMYLVHG